jgi:hypothetical protein
MDLGIFIDQVAAMRDTGNPIDDEQHGKADPTVTHCTFFGAVWMRGRFAYFRETCAYPLDIKAILAVVLIFKRQIRQLCDVGMRSLWFVFFLTVSCAVKVN